MLVRHVQERQAVSCLNSFAPHHYSCITLAAHQVSQSAALRFSSHFFLLLTSSVCLLLINQVIVFCVLPPPSSDALSPSPLICHPYQTLQGATKDKKKNMYFGPPRITLPSLILLFRARDMPLRTFPKFLEIWLQECLGAGMPLPLVFRGKASVCTHTAVHTHPMALQNAL